MTVTVLVVLWLIVVVPMILRRGDERRSERSVASWGRGMRALGRRAAAEPADGEASFDQGPDVFVPRPDRRAAQLQPAPTQLAGHERRPVPAAQEALMYPPDRADLSEARIKMLARRRRSLGTLIGGSVVFTLLGLVMGGIVWAPAVICLLGSAGYLLFLRNQATRDRARRENRQSRATSRRSVGRNLTQRVAEQEQFVDDEFEEEYGEPAYFADVPETVVRIDDDDIELQSMDTIDLTGLYSEEPVEIAQRRAS